MTPVVFSVMCSRSVLCVMTRVLPAHPTPYTAAHTVSPVAEAQHSSAVQASPPLWSSGVSGATMILPMSLPPADRTR